MTRVAMVRYGRLRRLAEFVPRPGVEVDARQECVVATSRGVELGTVLSVLERERDLPGDELGPVLRPASQADAARGAELASKGEGDLARLGSQVAEAGFKAVGVEWLFDAENVVVYYSASDRVDVPSLTARLGELLSGRVVLEQVGARQRARICKGGCGVCGRSLCCSSFLRKLRPVTMRMAKVQGLDLSPSRTAGACGRLKCCLRYENPLYEEASRGLPRLGWRVRTARLSGTVVAVDPLRRRVLVRPEGASARAIFADEIEHAAPPPAEPLPLAGEPEPEPTAPPAASEDEPAPEPGWSQLAKRLWRRVNRRGQLGEQPGADEEE